MARQQSSSIAGTITGAFDRVIRDYPLLVLHSAFLLGVLLGQQTAKTRFSLMDWARDALPERRSMTAALPSFTRRSSNGRKRGRRKGARVEARQTRRSTGRRRQVKVAAAAE